MATLTRALQLIAAPFAFAGLLVLAMIEALTPLGFAVLMGLAVAIWTTP